ncbi:helix-turn-helix domain-containing protein [Chitinophaga barathri]|uniref:AraC family transcriptional regulator n=1 Tax=Chitinophaga barathri TaxID=1647451 RepID=A0A3N4MFZ8_9BACT|nr:AraC family transcriptional regulator [Chitinophaga barathri]RPD42884.1 AraC family transcriptional regulator [Chitinophaga barathri]
MEADIHQLYGSGFYRVLDFKCRCTACTTSKPEYSQAFSISFVRKGNFLFNVFRRSLDSYTGCVLITKPGFERTVTHAHAVPDECTIFEMKPSFYNELQELYGNTLFFSNPDLHSTLLFARPDLEYLHTLVMQNILNRGMHRLQTDSLVIEIIHKVLGGITDYNPDEKISPRFKKNHLGTIETAKAWLMEHFNDDISLQELADQCHVSPFHFSRIFRAFTGHSPHQFLLHIRLKNAAVYLQNTDLPVSDIAFTSGFNSIEHFTAAFRQRYHCPPTAYRTSRQKSRIP